MVPNLIGSIQQKRLKGSQGLAPLSAFIFPSRDSDPGYNHVRLSSHVCCFTYCMKPAKISLVILFLCSPNSHSKSNYQGKSMYGLFHLKPLIRKKSDGIPSIPTVFRTFGKCLKTLLFRKIRHRRY